MAYYSDDLAISDVAKTDQGSLEQSDTQRDAGKEVRGRPLFSLRKAKDKEF